jgi:phosphoglycolate phosphatase-like HAD superfamily hydrolase
MENKIKLCFFDVDGTLSVPRYQIDGELKIGTLDGWIEYCVTHGPDTYDDCLPVEPVRRYAIKLHEAGAALYALSTSQTSFEHAAKQKFLDRHYPDLFDELITVARDEYKQQVIAQMAKLRGLPLTACELVEDTYATLLEAGECGIRVTHISMIV